MSFVIRASTATSPLTLHTCTSTHRHTCTRPSRCAVTWRCNIRPLAIFDHSRTHVFTYAPTHIRTHTQATNFKIRVYVGVRPFCAPPIFLVAGVMRSIMVEGKVTAPVVISSDTCGGGRWIYVLERGCYPWWWGPIEPPSFVPPIQPPIHIHTYIYTPTLCVGLIEEGSFARQPRGTAFGGAPTTQSNLTSS
jgi:hypothetical protein